MGSDKEAYQHNFWVLNHSDRDDYSAPTTSIYGLANGDFADVLQIPANGRAYCGHLLGICNTGFAPTYIGEWVNVT